LVASSVSPEGTGLNEGDLHDLRGLALVGLGRWAEAPQEAQWLLKSAAHGKDRVSGDWVAEERACILTQVGEFDAALDKIERILSMPAWFSVHTIRLDPRWDPIRWRPPFKALLMEYADPEK
jgi:hypothetical protein